MVMICQMVLCFLMRSAGSTIDLAAASWRSPVMRNSRLIIDVAHPMPAGVYGHQAYECRGHEDFVGQRVH